MSKVADHQPINNLKGAGWKPGESGNPAGRPKKVKTIRGILERIGVEEIKTKQGTMTKIEAILRVVYEYAIKGKPWAVEFIADRTEGKALQRTESLGLASDPLALRFYLDLPEDDLIREIRVLREQQNVIADTSD